MKVNIIQLLRLLRNLGSHEYDFFLKKMYFIHEEHVLFVAE